MLLSTDPQSSDSLRSEPTAARYTCLFSDCSRFRRPLSTKRNWEQHLRVCKFSPENEQKSADEPRSRSFRCDFCGGKRCNQCSIDQHHRICKYNPDNMPYECEFCGKLDSDPKLHENHVEFCMRNPDPRIQALHRSFENERIREVTQFESIYSAEVAMHKAFIAERQSFNEANDLDYKFYTESCDLEEDIVNNPSSSSEEIETAQECIDIIDAMHRDGRICKYCGNDRSCDALERHRHQWTHCTKNPHLDTWLGKSYAKCRKTLSEILPADLEPLTPDEIRTIAVERDIQPTFKTMFGAKWLSEEKLIQLEEATRKKTCPPSSTSTT